MLFIVVFLINWLCFVSNCGDGQGLMSYADFLATSYHFVWHLILSTVRVEVVYRILVNRASVAPQERFGIDYAPPYW